MATTPPNPLWAVRVSFVRRVPAKMWVLAQAHADSIRPFVGSEHYWLTYSRVSTQQFDPQEEIDTETWGFDVLVWVLRVIGWLLMVWGIKWALEIFTSLLAGVPVVGVVATAAASLVSWVLGTALSLLVIALAFLVIRPVVSLCVLGGLAIVVLAPLAHRPVQAIASPAIAPAIAPAMTGIESNKKWWNYRKKWHHALLCRDIFVSLCR